MPTSRTLLSVVPDEDEQEPTDAELDAIEATLPIVQAEVEVLDVEISLMDRPATPWSERRRRRAHRELLTARLRVANQARLRRLATSAPEVA
ncbi:DUF6284 family protein [Streptomyces sp. WMMB 322]|uniref:DUF6284 family protein n=1 Tax=Streptomyces sp. WMMB 322 TaxID=1286821 RepID=UPI0006E424C1|nr:DUF6284 family protein [Streptomyces sp. WMMB 322]SCK47203.1 hypothetical protein H180DRAFT_04209 [Streptomyces sp. WMMB 322]